MEKILLIVDDSKEIIDVLQEILKDQFDRILTASSVTEAQEKLIENVFSFIILDINLEGRNGAEVIKFLGDRPDNQNNQSPVLILSGILTAQFIEKYIQRFAAVVTKPFDHNELISTIKTILKKAEVGEDEIPLVDCQLPFPIPEIEKKVAQVLVQVKKNAKLKQLFADMKIDRNSDNYIMTHIGMLINISTAICTKLDWNTDKTLEKFVYASYLHDMALASRPDLARVHGSTFELDILQDKLPAGDYKLVMDHPVFAAIALDEIPEIPSDVSMIVRQHHELPKENGFPAKLSHHKITPLATVFIVAHDLTHFILEHQNWKLPDYLVKARSKFKGPHFAKILSALNEMN